MKEVAAFSNLQRLGLLPSTHKSFLEIQPKGFFKKAKDHLCNYLLIFFPTLNSILLSINESELSSYFSPQIW